MGFSHFYFSIFYTAKKFHYFSSIFRSRQMAPRKCIWILMRVSFYSIIDQSFNNLHTLLALVLGLSKWFCTHTSPIHHHKQPPCLVFTICFTIKRKKILTNSWKYFIWKYNQIILLKIFLMKIYFLNVFLE